MNIKQLETFLVIVRSGSFSAAADRLNATPSTVSARIHDLEDDLGTTLFNRTQRGTPLTLKGRELVIYAERATAAFVEIRTRVGNGQTMSGLIRLGVAEIVAVTWLPDLVALIHESYPKLVLELSVALTVELVEGVRDGRLDLALMPGGQFDADLTVRSLGSVQFRWMAGAAAKLPGGEIRPRDLGDMRILSLGKNSFHYHTVEQWLTLQGGSLHRVDICNSMSVVAKLTQAGIGVSLLPTSSYSSEIAAGLLQVLRTCPEGPTVECYAVHSKWTFGAAVQLIADLAVQASTFDLQPTTQQATIDNPEPNLATSANDPRS